MSSRLTRRTVLLGACAVLAGCAKPSATVVRPTASPTGAIADQLTAIMRTYDANTDKLGVFVRDPVSYTHLDVYKRQVPRAARR